MTPRTRYVVAGGSVLVLGLVAPAGAATVASTSTPTVVNREVVLAELASDGDLDVARLISQLTVAGNGRVKVADPVSGKNLRNLDGFGTPEVKDGKALYDITVTGGTTKRRTVSDFTKSLPVAVTAAYTLNGKKVSAKDIVGTSGDVTATYTVENVSGTPTTLTWKDGKGVTHTEQVSLPTPYVGQISTDLPASYTDLVTPAADAAGDGHGGTILNYSMVLFEPIGKSTQTFTWSGHVTKGSVPQVHVQVVPASPTQKPELNTGVEGYRDGAAKATQLTQGAGLIDSNLLKLQSGAGELLAGLTKLAAGAADLRDGLSDELAPGASKLAAGAGKAKAGTAKLSAGLDALSSGAGRLSDGLDEAATGSTALAGGLDQADAGATALAAGIAQILAGVKGLPATLQADPGYQKLLGALASVQAGITTKLVPGITSLKSGVEAARAGLQQISTQTSQSTTVAGLLGDLGQAIGAQGGVLGQTATATLLGKVQAIGTALTAQKTALLGGLDQVMQGLGTTTDGPTTATLQGGLTAVKLGVDNPACDPANPTNPANPCGIKQVQGLVSTGIETLVASVSASLADVLTQASSGAGDLASGVTQLADGGAALDSGLGQLADGGAQLADGSSAAADGAGQLDSGVGQLADGAGKLAAGADRAADGAGQIAGGLDKAKAGDAKVVDGAGRLRSEGTSALVAGGNDTAGENAEKYAALVALSKKAESGALPYGAPDGATGSAAYELVLASADSASHDNARRGAVAFLLLGAALAVSWAVRRRAIR